MNQGVGTRKAFLPAVQETKSSAFDHETKTPIENFQIGQTDGYITPVNSLTPDSLGPFEFVLPPQNDSYLMMNSMFLWVRGQVMRGQNGAQDMAADAVVAPCNLTASALWDSIEVKVNDKVLNASSSSYANYKAFIETVLSYDRTAKDSHLRAQVFSMDTPGEYNSAALAPADGGKAPNQGFADRNFIISQSKLFDMAAPIQCDFLRSNNHLAPGNKLTLKLTRAKDSFILISGNNRTYRFMIRDIRLYYRRLIVRPDAPLPNPQRYLMTRTELKQFPLAQNIMKSKLTLHNGGVMPCSIVIGQVLSAAANGDIHQNPFFFQHFNLKKLFLRVNGHMLPSDPLEFNFNQQPALVARPYMHMFQNTGAFGSRRGNLVSLTAFNSGLTLVPINLDWDLCNSFHIHAGTTGTIELELEWEVALADPITILVHMSYNEELQKDQEDHEFTVIQH